MKILTILALCGLALAQNGQQFYGNPDELLFPGPVKSRQERTAGVRLSIKRAQEINSLDTVEEFLNMIGVPTEQQDVIVGSRFGNVERSNAIIPVAAKCIPELQPVAFAGEDPDPSIVYFPSCVRIKRCGGCCSHPFLSCQPIASVMKNFQVVVSQVNVDDTITYHEKRIVPLEEHTRCKCNCRVQAGDCIGKQIYIPEECTCGCPNPDEEDKCRNNSAKYWDVKLCKCLCPNQLECNTGYYFNPVTCRCDKLALPSRFGNGREPGYRLRETSNSPNIFPPIVPLSTDDPRRKNKDDPEYK